MSSGDPDAMAESDDSDLGLIQGNESPDDGSVEGSDDDSELNSNKKRRELDWRVSNSMAREEDTTEEDIGAWLEDKLEEFTEDSSSFTKAQSYTNNSTGALVAQHRCSFAFRLKCPFYLRVVASSEEVCIETCSELEHKHDLEDDISCGLKLKFQLVLKPYLDNPHGATIEW